MKLAFTLSAYIALFLCASLDASAQRRPRRGPPPPPRAPAPERAPARPPTVETTPESPLGDTLDPRRSLMVTDALITDRFTFERTLDQLIDQTQAPISATELYQSWWATQLSSDQPGPEGIRCDDEQVNGVSTLNGSPIMCPRPEGRLSRENPLVGGPSGYSVIALSNRFDLASEESDSCGEYRIVYARNSGKTQPRQRNLIIFEAQLPNPNPECGLSACAPIAEFWAQLSLEEDANTRAEALERFYYEGLPGFAPVIHVNHFAPEAGQVRTNQFMGAPWTLKEFKLVYDCGTGDCDLSMVPVPVAGAPAPQLFGPRRAPRNIAFQSFFPTQVASLSADRLDDIFMEIPDDFYAGENVSQGPAFDLNAAYQTSPVEFRDAVQDELPQDSGLTTTDIMNRATAITCAGCHQVSNRVRTLGAGVPWAPSLGFVHISERDAQNEVGPDGIRYGISPALQRLFLPSRVIHLAQSIRAFSEAPSTCAETSITQLVETEDEATPLRPLPEDSEEVLPPLTQREVMDQMIQRNPRRPRRVGH